MTARVRRQRIVPPEDEAAETDWRMPQEDVISFGDAMEQAMYETPVSGLTRTPCTTVPPDMTVRAVIKQMNEKQIGCILVADRQRHLLGIFTDRDVLDRVVEPFDHLENKPITEVMTPNPWVVYEVDNMATVLSAMAVGELRHVPVLDIDGRVIGLITPRAVMAFIQKQIRGPDSERL